MQIAHAQVQMSSDHVFQQEHSKQESLRTWVGNERPKFEDQPQAAVSPRLAIDQVSLSATARRLQRQAQAQAVAPVVNDSHELAPAGEDPKLIAMRLILEALTGKKISIASLDGSTEGGTEPQPGPTPASAPDGQAPARAGWGLEYDYHETTAEHEAMSFQASGQVRTADGLELRVAVDLAMSRDFATSTDLRIRAGDALLVDPLVVNLSGQPPTLTDQTFAFDLNQDGKEERISFVSPGSGFLFLDRNHDQRPTDGSELFGPASGSGFAELATLDSDGNGWLDDNDPMFAKLQVWCKDAVGSDYFASLTESGVGALFLGHQATPFSLNDHENRQRGLVSASGIFLRPDGSAGTLQEIHLAA